MGRNRRLFGLSKADRIVLTSSKRGEIYHQIRYRAGDHIVFGPETSGLKPEVFQSLPSRVARIPIDLTKVRSLNLSTSVGIVVYEALKQLNAFPE